MKMPDTGDWLKQARTRVRDVVRQSVLGETPEHDPIDETLNVPQQDDASGFHEILKYDQYDDATGLFYNDNSVAFVLDVVPQTGADDEMVSRLSTLFTPIPPGTGVQWCLFGSSRVDDVLDRYEDLRFEAVEAGKVDPLFLDLAKQRTQFIRSRMGESLFDDMPFAVRRFRLVLSVTRSGTHDDPILVEQMHDLQATLLSSLRTGNLPARSMDADGLITFLFPIFNPEYLFNDDPLPDLRYDPTRPIKEQITAVGHRARVRTTEIVFGVPPADDAERDTRVAVRAFGIQRYPAEKRLWEMSNIIGSFTDPELQYPCPFLICGGVQTIERIATDNRVQLKAARAQQNAESKMAKFQVNLATQNRDWRMVQHQIAAGGQLCEIYHTLLLFAPKERINRASQMAINIWDKVRFRITPLRMLHLGAFYASLPMTLTKGAYRDLKRNRLMSTKTTVNAIDMAPVLAEWSGLGRPVLLLYGRRGTITPIDFYANKQGNYNLFATGVSGAGKTAFLVEVVNAYRSLGARCSIIDVGRGYENAVALMGGSFIEFKLNSDICINPFTWVSADSENTFEQELRLLKPMIGRMASPDSPLSPLQYSFIEDGITAVWADYGPESNPTRIAEYLKDKIKNEKGDVERIAFELSHQLRPFCKGGAFGRFFNGKANITFDNDLTALELEELKDAPELRRVVLFAATNRITYDMYMSPRNLPKLALIDEAWQLLGSDPETALFIEEGYRRARKYKGIFGLGTQSIYDAFKNDASKAAWNNSDWKIVLRQDTQSFNKMKAEGTIAFSPAVEQMIRSLTKIDGRFSEMVVISPEGEQLLRHAPDPLALMMASSTGEDVEERDRLLEHGHTHAQALAIMLERRGGRA
ncbi:type IV secretion system protein TraC [Burkholderia ubonensis]|uniref:type IV secretion system protein TraC n=1 Tax=Burkholderia ubonensis TaxID=101571 RepID=UPI0009B4687F|nr:type IV secretion system protein TraC [Burkholderia ubonensis]